MYSPQLLDHFQNPRNAGELSDADSVAAMANPACGDVLQLYLKLVDGRIAQVRFKAKGCVASIACGSVLSEIILGKTSQQAINLTREDVMSELGGLPQGSTHAAQLALDVLALALRTNKS
jgi:nitrogen fixation NifU-like protein